MTSRVKSKQRERETTAWRTERAIETDGGGWGGTEREKEKEMMDRRRTERMKLIMKQTINQQTEK